MRILVVDDSALMRTLVRSAVEANAPKGSVSIVEAQNGQDALARLDAGVGLVLLDWNMPRLDGLSFVRAVREAGNPVPIVMVTAVSSPDHVREAISAGISDYITKPFRVSEFWDRIKGFIS